MNTAGALVNLGIDTRPLEVDRISHQSLAVGNGSLPTGALHGEELDLIKPLSDISFSCSVSLSFRKAPVDKVPVLRVQHQTISHVVLLIPTFKACSLLTCSSAFLDVSSIGICRTPTVTG
nr:hypothetical protein [Tanacetum cinerariifolium]